MLPPDDHVHTEWSWDAVNGSMERTCARAVALGLPSVAFTEHVEFTPWTFPAGTTEFRTVQPPAFDLDGYLECVERCRLLFPGLRIRSGAEISEPHWHRARVVDLVGRAGFDRKLGSVHSLRVAPEVFQPVTPADYTASAAAVVRGYLAEVTVLAGSDAPFEVLAHIDYAVRYWPRAVPYAAADFEAEYRAALRALAGSSRVLEVNSRLPLGAEIVRWWRDCGGQAVSFGSDAHDPDTLARRFAEVAAVVEACGFRPAGDPHEFWVRG